MCVLGTILIVRQGRNKEASLAECVWFGRKIHGNFVSKLQDLFKAGRYFKFQRSLGSITCTLYAEGWRECQRHCRAKAECVAFTYTGKTKDCGLKKTADFSMAKDHGEMILGLPKCENGNECGMVLAYV